MRAIHIKVQDDLYHTVISFLKRFEPQGVIIEEKNTQADELKALLQHSNVTPFKKIDDPLLWQKTMRNEWE